MLIEVLTSRSRYVSENMTTRHAESMNTPEWMCFGIVLKTRTIDFSAETEEDAALWVVGLRTLLEQRRGDARGRAVGHFFWSRAAMKSKALFAAASDEQPGLYKTYMDFLAQKVRGSAETWWDAGAPGARSAASPAARLARSTYGGGSSALSGATYGGASTMMTASPVVARRLSPGPARRMSPQRMSFGSPIGGDRYSPSSPRGGGERLSLSPRGGILRSPTGFGASQSRISPPTTRLGASSGRALSPAGRRRNFAGGN